MNLKSKIYVLAVSLIGLGSVAWSLYHWDSRDLSRFACYLLVSVLAAGLKVNLPGIPGTMSVGFLFVFVGITELGLAETVVLGCVGTPGSMPVEAETPAGAVPDRIQHRQHRPGDSDRLFLPQLALGASF